jgi:hypothetical protein
LPSESTHFVFQGRYVCTVVAIDFFWVPLIRVADPFVNVSGPASFFKVLGLASDP